MVVDARRVILSVLLGCAALGMYAHAALPDVLQHPSQQSALATSRVILAVAHTGNRLFAVGERGIILLSDNNGNSWRQASVPVSVTLTNIFFITTSNGWAVGHSGVVLHSTDGGETWAKQLDGVEAAELILTYTQQTAESGDHKTAARLMADAEQLVSDGPDKPFFDVFFFDEMRGLVIGAFGLAFLTEDGGRHWQPWSKHFPNPKGKHLYRAHPRGDELWIIGEQGALFRSSDRGITFAEVPTPYVGSYFGMVTSTEGAIVVFGLRGTAYHSVDGGKTWNKIDNSANATFTDGLRLTDGSLILVDQSGRVLRSTDHGSSFHRLPGPQQSPINGIGQAVDGDLILATVRGIVRIPTGSLVKARQ